MLLPRRSSADQTRSSEVLSFKTDLLKTETNLGGQDGGKMDAQTSRSAIWNLLEIIQNSNESHSFYTKLRIQPPIGRMCTQTRERRTLSTLENAGTCGALLAV